MADIFISYKREDRDRVQSLASALESEGFSVWWDPELPIGRISFVADIKQVADFYVEVLPYGSAGKYRLRID